MRILVVINALGEGGTEMSTAQLLPHLQSRGIEASVAILRSRGAEGVEERVRHAGFTVDVLPAGFRRAIPELRRLIRVLAPDVLHSSLFEANLLSRFARPRGTPLLTSLVSPSYAPERFAVAGSARHKLRLTQAVDVLTAPLTTHFHAVSYAVARDASLRLRIKPTRITVVPRGRIDLRATTPRGTGDRVRQELGISPTDLVVMNVGRQEAAKNQLTLLAAMEPLLIQRPDVHLVIAGREGSATSAIGGRLATIAARQRVHLLGHRSDVGSLLDGSDLFVLPSLYEGMPGAVIEAMSMGLPVVASDIGPVREVLGHNELPTATDASALTRAIARFIDEPALRHQAGAANRARFEERFQIEQSADGMVDLYRRLAV